MADQHEPSPQRNPRRKEYGTQDLNRKIEEHDQNLSLFSKIIK